MIVKSEKLAPVFWRSLGGCPQERLLGEKPIAGVVAIVNRGSLGALGLNAASAGPPILVRIDRLARSRSDSIYTHRDAWEFSS